MTSLSAGTALAAKASFPIKERNFCFVVLRSCATCPIILTAPLIWLVVSITVVYLNLARFLEMSGWMPGLPVCLWLLAYQGVGIHVLAEWSP